MQPIYFSIIIATYNAAATLRSAINSILTQSYPNFEIILVDGKSTDHSVAIAKELLRSNDTLISEPDKGIYDAWNKGIRVAKGSHICFLGADDCFVPEALRILSEAIQSQPSSHIICGSSTVVDSKGNRIRRIESSWIWQTFRRRMTIVHVGAAHAASLFRTFGEFNHVYKITGDYDLLLRAGSNLIVSVIRSQIVTVTHGGVSVASDLALAEAYCCKILNHAASPSEATFDLLVAYIKMHIRPILYKIRLLGSVR